MDGISMRQPPQNQEAERALLGAILASPRAYHAVSDFLEPQHFIDPLHQTIFAACARRISAGQVADAVTLKDEVDLSEVGGAGYLAQLLMAMVGVNTAAGYGQAIKDAWVRRSVIEIGAELVSAAFDQTPDQSTSQLAADAFGKLTAAMENSSVRKGISFNEAMDEAIAQAEAAFKAGGISGISTGFDSLDKQIGGGLRPGNLIVLGARPGMGKTGLGLQIAVRRAQAAYTHVAQARAAGIKPDPKKAAGVLVVSLEMEAAELATRALSEISGVPGWRMQSGQLDQRDFNAIVKARLTLKDLPLTIEDVAGQSASTIALKARMAQRRHGLSLVVVDHLQIVRTDTADDKSGTAVAVGRVSGAMKRMAKDLGIPVLLLAQLSRGVEQRDDKRPVLSDLKYSGDIEQDADVVAFLYRAEYYLGKGQPERREGEGADKWQVRIQEWRQAKLEKAGRAEVLFEKMRGGSTGVVELMFDGPTTSFSEMPE